MSSSAGVLDVFKLCPQESSGRSEPPSPLIRHVLPALGAAAGADDTTPSRSGPTHTPIATPAATPICFLQEDQQQELIDKISKGEFTLRWGRLGLCVLFKELGRVRSKT